MNLFENLQLMHQAEHDIKISYDKGKPLMEMSKLMNEELDKSLFKNLDCRFIYFSQVQAGHGPRIKFDGGTSQSDTTQTSPSITFDKNYNFEVKLAGHMDKKSCPNAFNKQIIDTLKKFITKFLPILLLTWYEYLDDGYVGMFFRGTKTYVDLLCSARIPLDIKDEFIRCTTLEKLDEFCRKNDLYNFEKRRKRK